MKTNTLSLPQSKEKPCSPGLIPKPRIHTISEEFGTPGSSLSRAWYAGAINRREYEAGLCMAFLWQASGRAEQQARTAAGRAILMLGEPVAFVVASVCRDNGGVGNSHRAHLLRKGLSELATHFAKTGGFAND